MRNTFYNGLRASGFAHTPKRCQSGIATRRQRQDFYTKTQSFKSRRSSAIQNSYRKYQRYQDSRLSCPRPADSHQKKYKPDTLKVLKACQAFGKRPKKGKRY
mmetsp:Transcript_38568/g.38079  ORF Transcript_38568/g.38079 Transcript_38568/m.38079 type:complete len:102 (+) Transcript_38568:350-655(+)